LYRDRTSAHFLAFNYRDNFMATYQGYTATLPMVFKICIRTAKTRAILASSIYREQYVIELLYNMTDGEYLNLPLLPGRYV
jgi:hypothetical protein